VPAADALPPELAELVELAVSGRGLDARERREAEEELMAHFADGLASGRTVAELREGFGDPRLAAALIAKGKRSARSPLRRALRGTGVATSVVAAMYVASAVRLHFGTPRSHHPASGTFATLDVSQPAGMAGEAERLAASSGEAFRRGEHEAATRDLLESAAVARGLLDGTVAARLAGARAAATAAGIAAAAFRTDSAPAGAGARQRILPALRAMDPGAALQRALHELGGTLPELLDAMYTEGGALTADGLRLQQRLLGKLAPGTGAALVEPIYFAAPADRAAVAGNLDEVLASASRALQSCDETRLEAALSRVLSDRVAALRRLPVAIWGPRVAAAVRDACAFRSNLAALEEGGP
jgi:hypothetical protein